MNYIAIASYALIAIMVIGFFIGFCRNMKKSLIRTIFILVSLLAGVFLAPVLSNFLIDKFIQGTSFVGFGQNVDLQVLVKDLIGDGEIASDLFSSTTTTTNLTIAFINLVMNIVAFLAIFLVLYLLTLIVYWIVSICISVKNRKRKKQGEFIKAPWWHRLVGGLFGTIGSLMFFFVLLTPVFGIMNVCDEFVKAGETSASASAVNTNSLVCGTMYETEDSAIGQFEGYIEQYAQIKEDIDNAFIGKFFNYSGVGALGKTTFNYLTNVKANGLKVNLTNEFVAVVGVYNIYKENFVKNNFDLSNNDSLDAIIEIYDIANDSNIVKSYIEEFVPKFCTRWSNGEKFLGIAMPIDGEFEPVVKEMLGVFTTTNSTRIQSNVEAIIGVLKVANNNGVIVSVRENKDLITILSERDTLVKEEILQLSSTPELRTAMPKIIQEFLGVAYKEVVGGDEDFTDSVLTNQEIDAINWQTEAEAFQGLTTSVLNVYNGIKDNSDSSAMIDQLENIGDAIDNARLSDILKKPFKKFIVGYVRSDNINLGEDVKDSLLAPIEGDSDKQIESMWDNNNYKFKTTFATIGKTAKVAQTIVSGDGNVDISTLSGVLKDVIATEGAKETITTIIESSVVKEMVGDNKSAQVMTEVLTTFVEKLETEEDVDKALTAGQEIVNIVDNVLNNKEFEIIPVDGQTKEQATDNILTNIASSDALMTLIDENTSALSGIIPKDAEDPENNVQTDFEYLQERIDEHEGLTAEQKAILSKLFA